MRERNRQARVALLWGSLVWSLTVVWLVMYFRLAPHQSLWALKIPLGLPILLSAGAVVTGIRRWNAALVVLMVLYVILMFLMLFSIGIIYAPGAAALVYATTLTFVRDSAC